MSYYYYPCEASLCGRLVFAINTSPRLDLYYMFRVFIQRLGLSGTSSVVRTFLYSFFGFVSNCVMSFVPSGTAGRLLDDGHHMLPYNYDPNSGEAVLFMGNLAKRIPDMELR